MEQSTFGLIWWWLSTVCTGSTIAALVLHWLRGGFKIWIKETEPPRRFYVVYDKVVLTCEYVAGSKERLLQLLQRGKPSPAGRQDV